MDSYVTGTTIRTLREQRKLTQAELAERIGVSGKAVSKWETGKGLPDLALLQPLAGALGVSVIELMNGAPVANRNRAGNLLRSKFYVCPLCGNVMHATGEALVSCCGITLPPLESEEADEDHIIRVEDVEALPLWVDMHSRTGKTVYDILPLDQNIQDWKTALELTSGALAKAEDSYDRTMAIVGEGLEEVRAYLDSLPDVAEQ